MSETDDGFTVIPRIGIGGDAPVNTSHVNFSAAKRVAIPLGEGFAIGGRVDWLWDGNGVLRLRANPVGGYVISKYAARGRQAQVNTRPVQKHLGVELCGKFPILRRADGVMDIDLSRVTS